ncbi:MAG: hypothetical protein EZS28_017561, partial [Streblomastix strix]
MLKRKKMNKPMKLHQSKNKDYRINIISLPLVQENLGTQLQNDQGINVMSQMEKDDSGPAPVGVQEKPKKGKGSRKSKTESLSASCDPSKGSNAQIQTKQLPQFQNLRLRPKKARENPTRLNLNQIILTMRMKKSIVHDRARTLQSREISDEISLWNKEEERADEDSSSGDGGKDLRIDIQRKRKLSEGGGGG